MPEPITQLELARAGSITPEMEFVAKREHLEPELIRSEVAAGRMVIPANRVHLAGRLEPMGIGIAAKCKVNANIGYSAVTSNVDGELEKLHMAVHFGADTVMDLSTGKDIDRIRQAIIAASPVPIGTVPIYQMLEELGGNIEDMKPQNFLDMVEHQAKQGVDYMTVHCGVLLEHLTYTMNRVTGIVSRGGSLIAKWMMTHR
jgi:phosphomethylpyrimidine synthase